jgi:hypothetical protein
MFFRALPMIVTMTSFVFAILLLIIPLLVNELLVVMLAAFLESAAARTRTSGIMTINFRFGTAHIALINVVTEHNLSF